MYSVLIAGETIFDNLFFCFRQNIISFLRKNTYDFEAPQLRLSSTLSVVTVLFNNVNFQQDLIKSIIFHYLICSSRRLVFAVSKDFNVAPRTVNLKTMYPLTNLPPPMKYVDHFFRKWHGNVYNFSENTRCTYQRSLIVMLEDRQHFHFGTIKTLFLTYYITWAAS